MVNKNYNFIQKLDKISQVEIETTVLKLSVKFKKYT